MKLVLKAAMVVVVLAILVAVFHDAFVLNCSLPPQVKKSYEDLQTEFWEECDYQVATLVFICREPRLDDDDEEEGSQQVYCVDRSYRLAQIVEERNDLVAPYLWWHHPGWLCASAH